MDYLKRNWFTILIITVLPLPLLYFLWKTVPWADIPTRGVWDFWNKYENQAGLVVNLASSFIWATLCVVVYALRDRLKRRLFPETAAKEDVRVAQEKVYLKNLVARLRKEFPWDTEKYTELEAIQEDLESQAKRLRPRLWQMPDTRETEVDANIRTNVPLQRFLANEKQPVMLKGDPGTGKTLTVRRFIVDQAEFAEKNLLKEARIPIYVPLELYTRKNENDEPEPVYDFLHRYLQEEIPASAYLREHLAEYLLSGRILLVFDGLNELPPDEYEIRYKKLEEFVFQKYPRGKYIFTCRTLRHTSLSRFSTVAINELDNDKIKRFITAYQGPKRADELFQELTSGDGFMLRVCRNPFMLQMLVRLSPDGQTPTSPAQLFVEYTRKKLSEVTPQADKVANLLRRMAFAMQKEGLFAGTADISSLRKYIRSANFENYLQIAHKAQLVDHTPEKKVRFYHQVLQEHFAAQALEVLWEDEKDIEPYIEDYRWEETVIVCAGLVENTENFIRKIGAGNDSLPRRLWLAIKCIGNSGKNVSQAYYNEILAISSSYLWVRDWPLDSFYKHSLSPTVCAVETLKSLSYIDDSRVNRLINRTLLGNDGWIREVCAQLLGNSRHPKSKTLLAESVIKLRSFSLLVLVTPFYEKKEILKLIAGSPLFLYFTLDLFFTVLQHSMRFVPFLIIPVVFFLSSTLEMSWVTLVGRFFSLSIVCGMLSDKILEANLLSTEIPFKQKLTQFLDTFEWFDAVFFGVAVLAWIFAGEALALLNILNILLTFIVTGWLAFDFVRNLKHPRQLIYRLYSHTIYRSTMVIFLSFFAIVSSFFLMLWLNPYIPVEDNRVVSTVESSFNTVRGFLSSLVIFPFFTIMFIGFLSTCVNLVAFINYLSLRRIQKKAAYGSTEDGEKILKMALDNSTWLPTRLQAIKALRLIEVPPERLGDLEALIPNLPELRRELEQTVYELRVQTLKK